MKSEEVVKVIETGYKYIIYQPITVKILKDGYKIYTGEKSAYMQREPYIPYRKEKPDATYEEAAEAQIKETVLPQSASWIYSGIMDGIYEYEKVIEEDPNIKPYLDRVIKWHEENQDKEIAPEPIENQTQEPAPEPIENPAPDDAPEWRP